MTSWKLGTIGHALGFLCLLADNLWAAEGTIVYPQLAIGGGFEAVLVVSNPAAEPWSGTVRLPAFGAGSGIDWLVDGQDRTGSDSFPVTLEARASRRFVISAPPDGGPVSGAMEVVPTAGSRADDLAMSLFYDYSVDDALVDSVSVPSSPSGRIVVAPIERFPEERINTGLAILSDSDAQLATVAPTNPSQPFFRVSLHDADGILVDERVVELSGALFVDQIFPAEVFPEGRFVGSLAVESETPFHLLALRQRLLDEGRFQLTGVAPWIAPADTPVETFAARYRVTFQADWSAQTHPTDFPSGAAHFSALVGGVHDDSVDFWEPGVLATPGIEMMAEMGRVNPLANVEVQSAITQSRAGMVLVGGGISPSPGEVTLEFDMNQRYPLVTLVSMIAPSPDWFVGVRGLNLFGATGWIDELTVDLYPYDAGTDDGSTFRSEDAESQPHQPISRLTGFPFLNQGVVLPMGHFIFTRLDGDSAGS